MCEEMQTTYQDILTESMHTICKYIHVDDFTTELMSGHFLSPDDKERISNPYTHPSRREQAVNLVEVLMTKGPKAYEKFLEIMEFNYPHVFKEITKKEPRKPPPGFHQSRQSERIRLLDDLPVMAKKMQQQYKQNNELSNELTEFQALLELSQKENTELEEENISLREKLNSLSKELDICKKQLDDKTKKFEQLQADNANNLQKVVFTMEELQKYKDKQQELLTKIDTQTEQLADQKPDKGDLNRSATVGPGHVTNVRSAALVKPTPPPKQDNMTTVYKNLQRMNEKIRILESNLEERDEQNSCQAERISELQQETSLLEDEIKTSQKRAKQVERELDALKSEKEKSSQKLKAYFDIIQKQEKEKQDLEDEKLVVQGKLRDANQEKNDLFKRMHSIEVEMEELRLQNEKMKARDSMILPGFTDTLTDNNSTPERMEKRVLTRQEDRYYEEPAVPDISNPAAVVKFATLPATFNPSALETDIVRRPYDSQRTPSHNQSFESENGPRDSTQVQIGSVRRPGAVGSHPRTIFRLPEETIPTPGYDEAESVESVPSSSGGGPLFQRGPDSLPSSGSSSLQDFPNHEEYSILLPQKCEKVTRRFDVNSNIELFVRQPAISQVELHGGNHTGIFVNKTYLELKEGDQIQEMMYKQNGQEVKIMFVGKTLNEAVRLLQNNNVREMTLIIRRCRVEYESAQKWMLEHEGSGDFFYIRCNRILTVQQQNSAITIEIRPGDLFLVSSSNYDQKHWLGRRVDKLTGDRSDKEYFIPNTYHALLKYIRSNSDVDDHRKPLKVKGNMYDRVLPMKAIAKLPVALVGLPALQDEVLSILARDTSGEYYVNTGDKSDRSQEDPVDRQVQHYVSKRSAERFCSRKHLHDIILLLVVDSSTDLEKLRKVFGQDFNMALTEDVVKACSDLRQKLTDTGKIFEEVCVSGLENQQDLLASINQQVRSSQDRILWLCRAELDPVIVEKNVALLGTED